MKARGPAAEAAGPFLRLDAIIPKPVKKLFIAPKVRQILYETSQRVFTRCACARRTGFLIQFLNQESVLIPEQHVPADLRQGVCAAHGHGVRQLRLELVHQRAGALGPAAIDHGNERTADEHAVRAQG